MDLWRSKAPLLAARFTSIEERNKLDSFELSESVPRGGKSEIN